MIRVQTNSRFDRLQHEINSIFQSDIDDKYKSICYRYYCIRISGEIDRCIEIILSEYAKSRSTSQIASFVRSQFKKSTNYDSEKVVKVFGNFSEGWKNDVDSFLTDKNREILNSLISSRNLLAHGNVVGISENTIRSHLRVARELIDTLVSLVEPVR